MDRESEYELEVKQIAVPGVPHGLGVGRLEAGELGAFHVSGGPKRIC